MDLKKVAASVATGRVHLGVCPICGPTVFVITGPWLRDQYLCRRCHSIPRQRALVRVLRKVAPHHTTASVFESSPGTASSDWLARRCTRYQPSQYFSDIAPGDSDAGGIRSEDLQALTLPDNSVDIFITQDVFEHIVDPDAALAEITRVLAPGGMHIWTVPIFRGRTTLRRAEGDGKGGVRHLMEPDYHGNPLGGGSLVIHEWGDDFLPRIDHASGLTTTRHDRPSWWNGIRGEMIDVLVTRKVSPTARTTIVAAPRSAAQTSPVYRHDGFNENWLLNPLWTDDLRRLDERLAPDLSNIGELAEPLPLRMFGQILLDPVRWLPQAGAFLPVMPPDDVQVSWTGSSGEALLNQSVEFIRTVAASLSRCGISIDNGRLLDFGVGWGRLARLWLKYAPPEQLLGCDAWQRSLDEAVSTGLRNELVLSSDLLDPLPFPEEHFDAAYACSVFTHLSPTASATCLSGIARMLRPGGAVVFTVRPELYWRVPAIEQELEQRGIRDLAEFTQNGSTFIPHGGQVHYGDTSLSRAFLEQRCAAAGLDLVGFEWSMFDEYEVVVTAVRCRAPKD